MTETVTRHLKIVNEKGLHARAAAKLVEVVEGFDAAAEVSHDGQSTGADSIMGLLMLAASKGMTIDVRAWGPDAEALADAVEALVADRFGEDM
ncbi:HPr family phosphocarrier protein [Roseovarius aestuariivivens]|uniref:HPr family phosphocarrier protein n=1 Tax=Roseovarius aestuariivivens TaxID=1888910 RepID=UPI0010817E1F|nr:HPr family phosphocarrier protein [Roseovarius aestuariivivens]